MDPVVDMYDNYEKTSNVLEQKAAILEDPSASIISPVVRIQSRIKKLTGLWMNPIAVTSNTPDTSDMHRDLSSFLSISGVPSTIEVSPGQAEDVAALVSKAIFANAPLAFGDLADDTDPVTVSSFSLKSHAQDCAIQVRHAFYTIPLPPCSPNGAWHSTINVKLTTTKDFRRAQASKIPLISTAADVNATHLDLSWIATVKVDWATRRAAEEAAREFQKLFSESQRDFVIDFNSVVGGDQLLKIKGPKGVSPAEIKVCHGCRQEDTGKNIDVEGWSTGIPSSHDFRVCP
ncbi:hypothetical protein N7517_011703 [Penicillium concentricum]|uniref:Uncharacterized protein n=1 Tax=Penicillium concentricum TaxID=293559 RepID=A0A9W9RDV2_9EURO|nr:uncharacterized protein N7517_011703 [Penicillium concentricum]KAJ5357094.1 hypothetical protein N7517_011703 [Penicillium concentricum]